MLNNDWDLWDLMPPTGTAIGNGLLKERNDIPTTWMGGLHGSLSPNTIANLGLDNNGWVTNVDTTNRPLF